MAHPNPAERTVYSSDQVQQYLDTIRLPAKYRASPVLTSKDAVNTAEGLLFLSKLIKYQIAAIPFENLELHYSSHHTITLDPLHLLHKIAERPNGRGGYCMENTCILATVLRSLGYSVMSTGARVNEVVQPISQSKGWGGPKYDGWNHMVNIVTIEGRKYLVDVGFGSNGPTFPVPLQESYSAMNVKAGPSGGHEMLLKRGFIPDNTHQTDPAQELWLYSLRFSKDMDWLPGYCFSEVEFLPRDFETMNFFVSKSPTSWFTYHVVALRYLMDENEDIVGDITLFGHEIKERRNGVSKELCKITSEAERVEALEKYLGIKLSGPERAGIHGMVTMM